MKKILLIIPVVFCLVLSSLSIIPVHAANYLQTPAESYEGASCMVHPLDNLLEAAGNPKYYFWYNTYRIKDDDKYQIETKFIYYNGEINVEEENGVYTINFLGSSGYDLITVEHDSLPDYDFKSGASATDVLKTIIFDSNTNDLSRVRDNGEIVSYITEGFLFNVYETNMFEADSGDLTVEITPELNGKVSKTVEMDGTKYDYPYLQLYVKNKSSRDYQYAFFIVNKGEKINYEDILLGDKVKNDGYANGRFYSNNPVFAYVTTNWFFTTLNGDVFKVNAPSAWHFVGAGDTQGVPLLWDKMKLKKDVEYDVVVLACKLNPYNGLKSDCPIAFVGDSTFLGNEEYPFELYRSTFTMDSDTPFDGSAPTTSNGQIPYDPDANIDDMYDNLKGYYDRKNDNKLVITDSGSKFGDYSSGNIYDYYPSGSSSSSSYGSILSNINCFFKFISTTLGYFPVSLLSVFNFALIALLILAVIRRLH